MREQRRLFQSHQFGGGAHSLEGGEGAFVGGAFELRLGRGGVIAREIDFAEIEIDIADALGEAGGIALLRRRGAPLRACRCPA